MIYLLGLWTSKKSPQSFIVLQYFAFAIQSQAIAAWQHCIMSIFPLLQYKFLTLKIIFFDLYINSHANDPKRRIPRASETDVSKPSWKYQYTTSWGVHSFQGDPYLFWPSGWVRWVGRGSVYIPKANEWFHYMTWLYLLHSHSDKEDICFCVKRFKKIKPLFLPQRGELSPHRMLIKDTVIIPACSTHALIATCCWVCVTISKPSSVESQEGPLWAAVSSFMSLEWLPSSCIHTWPKQHSLGFLAS